MRHRFDEEETWRAACWPGPPGASRCLPVQTLQEYPTFLGVNPGFIDGIFGPKTEAAVKRFHEP